MRIVLVVLLLCGCAAELAAQRQDHVEKLLKRAAFDLSCPKEQLKMTCLNGNQLGDGEWCLTAGVEACGHKATYVYQETSANTWQWVMNNVDGQVK
jgi:hypothetical protein